MVNLSIRIRRKDYGIDVIEFKEEACKRVQSGVPAVQAAGNLVINVNILYAWMSRFKNIQNSILLAVETSI